MQKKIVPIDKIRPRSPYCFVLVYREKLSQILWTPFKEKNSKSTAFGLVVAAPDVWRLDIPRPKKLPDCIEWDRFFEIEYPLKKGDWIIFETGFGTIINVQEENHYELGKRPELRCLDLHHSNIPAILDEFDPFEEIADYSVYEGV